jgi:tetratricopeptide (TPR) repeat protein/Zn-dependent membrane protease YugP
MDLDDQWDILLEFLPSLPLLLGILAGAMIVQAAVRLYQRAVMRHGIALAACGLTGELVARRLLADCGLGGVRLVCQGLRDLYHPWKREIRLCATTFNSPSLGALAVAAHEVGHAQQFAEGTLVCRVRQVVWPLSWALTGVAILFPLLPFLGVSLVSFDQSTYTLLVVVVVTLAMQLPILLPLERDASRRAKRLAEASGLLSPNEVAGFEAILKSAWLTYVAIEIQRWILVLAAGVFLCFSPAIVGLEGDAPLNLFPIEDVSIQDTILPIVEPLTQTEFVDEAPLTYWEAVLPSLLVLVVLFVICHLLSRFSNLKPQDRSNRALAIERSNAGLECFERGAYQEAIDHFTQALVLDPKLGAALYNRGHTMLKMGRLDDAMCDLDAALLVEPGLIQAYVARGDIWLKRGDSDRAMHEYDTAHGIAPHNPVVLACRGYTWFRQQHYDRALADFEQALKLNPQDSWSLAGRGLIRLTQGDIDRAFADCDRAITAGATDGFPFAARGRVWMAKDDHGRAIADFNESLRREPGDAAVFRDRGLAYYFESRFDLAAADLSESVRLEPADNVAWNNYGAALYGLSEYSRAVEALRESIRLNPSFPNPYRHLAWLQATCPDVAFRDGLQAVANATRALELAEWKPVEWLSVLAVAHRENGDFAEAEKWETRQAALQAEHSDPHAQLALQERA